MFWVCCLVTFGLVVYDCVLFVCVLVVCWFTGWIAVVLACECVVGLGDVVGDHFGGWL